MEKCIRIILSGNQPDHQAYNVWIYNKKLYYYINASELEEKLRVDAETSKKVAMNFDISLDEVKNSECKKFVGIYIDDNVYRVELIGAESSVRRAIEYIAEHVLDDNVININQLTDINILKTIREIMDIGAEDNIFVFSEYEKFFYIASEDLSLATRRVVEYYYNIFN